LAGNRSLPSCRADSSGSFSYHSNASSVSYNSRPGSVIEQSVNSVNDSVNDPELSALHDGSDLFPANKKKAPSPIERLTPCQYAEHHIPLFFGSSGGDLYVVPPFRDADTPVVSRMDIQDIIVTGPLLPEATHTFPQLHIVEHVSKKVVLHWISKRAEEAMKSGDHSVYYNQALKLLWDFIALLIRQNGHADGSDVAKLLMQGRQPIQHTQPASQEKKEERRTQDEITFQQMLFSGNVLDALDHACENELWAHALMLATNTDAKVLEHIQTRFISSLSAENPFRTLLYHHRTQDLKTLKKQVTVTNWQEHLAMIIANPSMNQKNDFRNILAFGDSLMEQNLLPAAHLCYLLAGEDFARPSAIDKRLSLIGVDHRLHDPKKVCVWVKDINIQMTELFCFAKRLRDKAYSISTLQEYKIIYANRLVEAGKGSEALGYFQSISQAILSDQGNPQTQTKMLFSVAKISKDLFSRDNSGDEEPEWLQALSNLPIARFSLQKGKSNETKVDSDSNRTSNIKNSVDLARTNMIASGLNLDSNLLSVDTSSPANERLQPTVNSSVENKSKVKDFVGNVQAIPSEHLLKTSTNSLEDDKTPTQDSTGLIQPPDRGFTPIAEEVNKPVYQQNTSQKETIYQEQNSYQQKPRTASTTSNFALQPTVDDKTPTQDLKQIQEAQKQIDDVEDDSDLAQSQSFAQSQQSLSHSQQSYYSHSQGSQPGFTERWTSDVHNGYVDQADGQQNKHDQRGYSETDYTEEVVENEWRGYNNMQPDLYNDMPSQTDSSQTESSRPTSSELSSHDSPSKPAYQGGMFVPQTINNYQYQPYDPMENIYEQQPENEVQRPAESHPETDNFS
jgi:hypothetical protein